MAELIDENVSNNSTLRPAPRSAGSSQRWFKKRDPVAGTPGTTDDETYNNDNLGMLRHLFAQTGIVKTLGAGGDADLYDAIVAAAGLPKADRASSSSNTIGTVEADTALSITVPAGGTWEIHVEAVLHADLAAPGGSDSARVDAEIDEQIDAGGWVDAVASSRLRLEDDTPELDGAIPVLYDRAATGGSTYEFRLSATTSTTGAGTAALGATAGRLHRIRATLVRVA